MDLSETPRNFEVKVTNYPKEDTLGIIRFFSFDIFQTKPVNFIVILNLQTNMLVVAIQIYLFLKNFDVQYFLNYGPSSFLLVVVIISYTNILKMGSYIKQPLTELQVWMPQDTHKLTKEIRKEANFLNRLIVLHIICGIISGFIFFYPTEADEDMFIVHVLVKNYVLPEWKNGVAFFFGFCCAFATCVGLGTAYQIIYDMFHFKSQCQVLMALSEMLNFVDIEDGSDELYNSELQEQIKNMLKVVVDRHNDLIKIINETLKKIWGVIIAYTLAGLFFAICFLFFVLSFKGPSFASLRLVPLCSTTIVVGVLALIYGQLFENITHDMYHTLYSLKWYKWNKENKLSYLIMLANFMRPFRIGITERVALNSELGIQAIKTVYSVVSVLIQMRN